MPAVDPYKGYNRGVGNPDRWETVTPHASNYLEGDASNYNVAVAFYTPDGGTVTYYDAYDPTGSSKSMVLGAGTVIPGKFVRVTSFSGTLYAAFLGDVVS